MPHRYRTGQQHQGASRHGSPRRRRASRLDRRATNFESLTVSLGAVVAITVGLQVALGRHREASLLALVIAVSSALVWLAYRRFELFVALALGIRTAADLFRGVASDELAARSSGVAASAIGLLFLAASGLWLLAQQHDPDTVARSRLRLAIAVFLVAAAVSAALSGDPQAGIVEVGRMATGAAMFLVLERLLASWRQVRLVLAACLLSTAVPVTVAILQQVLARSSGPDGTIERLTGSFTHPNAFGLYLAMMLVMSTALFRHLSLRQRLAVLLFIVPGWILLLLTYSRGAWIGALVGVVLVSFLQSRRTLVLLPVLAAVAILALPSLGQRIADFGEDRTLAGAPANSLVWRLDHWGELLENTAGNHLLGSGPGTAPGLTSTGEVVHNDFLRSYVELGLLGLLAYLGLAITLITTARRSLLEAPPGLGRGVAVGFAGCVATFVVVSSIGNVISQVVVTWYFFAFAAVAVSVTRLQPDQEIEPVRHTSLALDTTLRI